MERAKTNAKVKLTQAQYDGLEKETRHSLIRQIFFIETPDYEYCWGAQGNWWTIVRYDKVDGNHIDKDTATIVEKWL